MLLQCRKDRTSVQQEDKHWITGQGETDSVSKEQRGQLDNSSDNIIELPTHTKNWTSTMLVCYVM